MNIRNGKIASILLILIVTVGTAGPIQAWVGLELDARSTGIEDRYGATGTESRGAVLELSGRVMYQVNSGALDAELHWLGQAETLAGDIPPLPEPSG